jgi:ABC-type branched-subunit amino acid transport system substrate-binding protein
MSIPHKPSTPRPSASKTVCRLLAIWLLFIGFPVAAELTEQELNGQRIYNQGIGQASITVLSGVSDIQLPARSMPCARCHGEDGAGQPIGGLMPSVITWPHLSKASGHQHGNGRKHPAFDDESLARLIRSGTDPAGNKLEPAMPRFLMSQEDMESLLAYLKQLQWIPDPGMESGRLQLATLLPVEGPLAALGKEILDILRASLNLINKAGGVHGRLLKLEVADFTGEPATDLKNLETLMTGEHFALLSPFLTGIEQQALALAETNRIPIIAPFTSAEEGFPKGRYSFHLFGGLHEQTHALTAFVSQTLPQASVAVLRPHGRFDQMAEAAGAQVATHGWEVADSSYDPASVDWPNEVRKLRQIRRTAVLFYGEGDELLGFLQAAEAQSWQPLVLTFGSLAGNQVLEIPGSFADRLVLAYRNPPIPTDHEKAREFFKLRHKSDSPNGYLPAQIAAYSAARLLEEGLFLAGRSAKREDLVQALESPRGFMPGTVPWLRFGPERRAGAQGAHLAMIDPEQGGLRAVSLWHSLDKEPAADEPTSKTNLPQFGASPFQRTD